MYSLSVPTFLSLRPEVADVPLLSTLYFWAAPNLDHRCVVSALSGCFLTHTPIRTLPILCLFAICLRDICSSKCSIHHLRFFAVSLMRCSFLTHNLMRFFFVSQKVDTHSLGECLLSFYKWRSDKMDSRFCVLDLNKKFIGAPGDIQFFIRFHYIYFYGRIVGGKQSARSRFAQRIALRIKLHTETLQA